MKYATKQNTFANTHFTLGMLLHYLGKLKILFLQIWKKIDKILIGRLYFKGYIAKRLTDEFPQKSWKKRGVNKHSWKCYGIQAVDRQWHTSQCLH